jgi:gliding motility-associated-like protein
MDVMRYRFLFIVSLIISLVAFSYKSKATHISGADFYYTHLGGLTYQVTLVVYGDCGGSAFPSLSSSSPEVQVYNNNTLFQTISLGIQPGSGIEVTPVCPSQINNTKCTNVNNVIPGIKKYIYSDIITLNTTSANWRFLFTGFMGNNTNAGRSNSITNLATASTITNLEATLNNTFATNSSPTFTVLPTPFFCINKPSNYNLGSVDIENDSLFFALVPGLTTGGVNVSYAPPYTAATPLSTTTGTFSFSSSTGQLNFTPNITQVSLVVQRVYEYRNGLLIGTSMREMNFIVFNNCNNNPPVGNITGVSSNATQLSSSSLFICQQQPAPLMFNINPSDLDGDKISIIPSGLPNGMTANIVGNNTTNPSISFSWNTTNVAPGTYIFFLTFQDDGCPLSSKQTIAYTIIIRPKPNAPVITTNAPLCQGQTLSMSAQTSSTGSASYAWTGPNNFSNTNASFTIPNVALSNAGTYTAVATINACISNPTSINVVVNPTPPVLTTNNVALCQSPGSLSLAINHLAIYTLKFYTTATGGVGTTIAPIINTSIPGTYTFYVSQLSAAGCESARVPVTVTVTPKPPVPIAVNTTYCQLLVNPSISYNVTPLSGYSLNWYTSATGGSALSSAPTINLGVPGTTTFYVSQALNGGCESDRVMVSNTVYPTPPSPTVNNINVCQFANVVPISITPSAGCTLQWYTSATGGTPSTITPTYSTSVPFTITYYVSQVNSSNCESARVPITVSVTAMPTAPVATNLTYCQFQNTTALTAPTATGNTLLWYVGTSTVGSAIAPIPNTNVVGTTTYYVSQVSGGNCEGPKSMILVTVNATPPAPTASNLSYCLNAASTPITLTFQPGNSLLWYSSATGGVGNANTPIVNTAIPGTITYYASQITPFGCESNRTNFTVTVYPIPPKPIVSNLNLCQGQAASPLSAQGIPGATIYWYNFPIAANGTTTAPIPSTTNLGITTYYVNQAVGNNCLGPIDTLRVTVNPSPIASIIAQGPVQFCQGDSTILIANTGANFTYQWYNNGIAIPGATSNIYIAKTSGTYTIRITNTSNCTTTSNAIVVTVFIVNTNITTSGPLSFCSGGSVTFTAAILQNATYQWYYNGAPMLNGYTNTITVNASGVYKVLITDSYGCSSFSNTYTVTVLANPSVYVIPKDSIQICEGASFKLSAKANMPCTFQWYLNNSIIQGATDSVYFASQSGLYTVQATSSFGCKGVSNPFKLIVVPLPTIDLPNDTTIFAGDQIEIIAQTTNSVSILWTPSSYLSCINCYTTYSRPEVPITYTATVANELNCLSSDTIRINLKCNDQFVFIPNVFSPNADDNNDVFYPRSGFKTKINFMKIYNRWGQLIFENYNFISNDPLSGWDGTFKNTYSDAGLYSYIIQATCFDGSLLLYNGDVTMLR